LPPEFEDQWRERFEEFASARDDDAGIAGWSPTGLAARVRRFRALWRPPQPAGGLWLDAGCGAGTYTRLLLDARQNVIGVDYSQVTLRKAAARDLAGARFVAADVRHLPFRAARFDGALCLGVTQALAESGTAIDSLAAALKPGAELWLDALNGWCVIHVWGRLRRQLRGRPRHLRYESPWRMRRQMRQRGFEDVRLHWMPIAPAGSPVLRTIAESAVATRLFRIVPPLGALFSHAFILTGRRAP
jgi:SAM-dependent methyltransferase